MAKLKKPIALEGTFVRRVVFQAEIIDERIFRREKV